jgi:hypothetical protein
MMIPKPGIMDTDPNQEWAMPDESTVENLYETTLEYYNLRPILKDMPAKTPRGPTPDAPAENALLSATLLAASTRR